MSRSSPLVCLALVLGACVTVPRPLVAPGSGPPLYVAPDSVCRTDPLARNAAATVPDRQLCREISDALEVALYDAGYRVVARPDEPHAANLHVFGEQTSTSEPDGTTYTVITVQVTVVSIGQEIDRSVEDGTVLDANHQKDQVMVIANAVANGLSHSPRMRRAGLIPAP
jgi:hypothetical protein